MIHLSHEWTTHYFVKKKKKQNPKNIEFASVINCFLLKLVGNSQVFLIIPCSNSPAPKPKNAPV